MNASAHHAFARMLALPKWTKRFNIRTLCFYKKFRDQVLLSTPEKARRVCVHLCFTHFQRYTHFGFGLNF